MLTQPDSSTSVVSDWHTPESRWDWFFLVVLTSLLVFLPFSLGAVEAWSELVVVCAAVTLVIGLLLRVWFDSTFRLARSWTYLPLIAVLMLIVVQLVPLPTVWVHALSSRNVELRQELLSSDAPAISDRTTLSLYAYETSHDLRMALVFTALFVTAACVFRSSAQIKRALLVVFLIGCAEAGIGLLQILSLSTKIHWMLAERGGVVTSGSFINHSHFSQFLNLTIGAGIALLLVRMKEDSRRDRGSASRLTDLRGDRYLRPLTGIVLCAVAVFTSMSRNGAISLLLASGVIGMLIYRKGVLSVRGWLIGMVPWCVVLVLFLTCFDTVYDRFATLEEDQQLDVRLEMTAGTLRAWRDFPVWGTGLGTHEYVFPLYDSAVMTSMAEHADNDWAQLLEEFGLLGTSAVLAFVGGLFWVAGRLILFGKTTLSTATYGLCFGLLATAWHSLSDFGQHLPGIFSLTAVVSGLVVAIARYEARKTRENLVVGSKAVESKVAGPVAYISPVGRKVLTMTATVLLLLLCWWAVSGAMASYRREAWSNVALGIEQRLQQEEDWLENDQAFVDLLTATQHAAEAEPANVKSGHLLNLSRWRSISRTRNLETGQILLDPGVVPFVSRIVEELARLRLVCPLYSPLYGLEGELRWLVLDESIGSRLINQAARLTPYDAQANLLAGELAAGEGRHKESVGYLNRAVALNPRHFQRVARMYLDQLQRPQLALELAGENYRRMGQLARLMEEMEEAKPDNPSDPSLPSYPGLIQELKDRSLARLRELVDHGAATASETANLASVEFRNENPRAAIDLYRRALAQKYGQISWRLALAQALMAAGENKQALREARICLRLRPKLQAATRLIEELSVLPDSPSADGPNE